MEAKPPADAPPPPMEAKPPADAPPPPMEEVLRALAGLITALTDLVEREISKRGG
jgi:hypothetical protein